MPSQATSSGTTNTKSGRTDSPPIYISSDEEEITPIYSVCPSSLYFIFLLLSNQLFQLNSYYCHNEQAASPPINKSRTKFAPVLERM